MKKYILRYSLIASIILIVIFSVSFIMMSEDNPDYALSELIGYSAMIISLATIFFAIKHFRDRELNGNISFKKALGLGCMIALIVALVFVCFDLFYVAVIDPDFMVKYQAYQVELMEAEGADQDAIDAMNTEFEAFQGPMGRVLMELVMLFTVFVIGLIISLISAAVLKSEPTTVQAKPA